jgi:hypothetical protein
MGGRECPPPRSIVWRERERERWPVGRGAGGRVGEECGEESVGVRNRRREGSVGWEEVVRLERSKG